jgi:DNA adenine methylase
MTTPDSPLRYPGGKQMLSALLGALLRLNRVTKGTFVEPYAGGAGAALSLLFSETVSKIILNDADPCVYAFWKAAVDRTDELITLIQKTPIDIDTWKEQRAIHRNPTKHDELRIGFATFYLNRCNRSGIIANGGAIGGIGQSGKWKLDARFNKAGLIRRLQKLSCYSGRIEVYNLDAIDFLRKRIEPECDNHSHFVYLDPPYFEKGSQLYLNHTVG